LSRRVASAGLQQHKLALTLTKQEFDVTYFRQNSSIKFAISATSIGDGINATANVIVNAYGERPISFNFYLCEVLGGALCPLPKYNFTGRLGLKLVLWLP